MQIVLDKGFYHKNFGAFSIYSEKQNEFFPHKDWNDFFVSIVIDWYTEVKNHQQYAESEFDLLFMDGPYYLHVIKSGNDCKITGFWEDAEEVEPLFSETTYYDLLAQSLSELAFRIFNECDAVDEYDKKVLHQLLNRTDEP